MKAAPPLKLDFTVKLLNERATDDELVADLKRVANELGVEVLSWRAYKKFGAFSPDTISHRLGWQTALASCGLRSHFVQNASEEHLMENLMDVWVALGRQPRSREMRRPLSKWRSATYEARFHSWNKALLFFSDWIQLERSESPSLQTEPSRAKTHRDVNLRLRFMVMKRDSFKCTACGRSPATHTGLALHVDHVLPFSKGGQTAPENLQTLCADCNLGKSDL